jgi:hypothetical protein
MTIGLQGQVAGRYAPVRIDEAVRRFDVWHALLLFANTCYGVRCSLRIADLTKAKGKEWCLRDPIQLRVCVDWMLLLLLMMMMMMMINCTRPRDSGAG